MKEYALRLFHLQLSAEQFRPGDPVATSGIYSVHHYAHRLPHNAFIQEATTFPDCKSCAQSVRYFAVMAVDALIFDHDFTEWITAAAAGAISS